MTDPGMMALLGQFFGVLATGLVLYAFSHKCDSRLKLVLVLASLTFALHYALLGGIAGALVSLINAVRNYIALKFYKSTAFMYLFLAIYAGIAVMNYGHWYDLLPSLAGSINTIAFYKLSGIGMRVLLYGTSASWITYGLRHDAYGAILSEIFIAAMNTITIARLFAARRNAGTTGA